MVALRNSLFGLTISGIEACGKLTAQSTLCDDLNSFEKGTPVERQGRKATGLRARPMTAGLPTDKPVATVLPSQATSLP